MATAPANDFVDPVVAGEIIIVDPRRIRMGERLRAVDLTWAEAIGTAIERDGQITPIDVCPVYDDPACDYELAGPGGHRLQGALIREHDGIEARVVSSDRDVQRRREAAENLFRRANDPMERAAAIAELVRISKQRAGVDPQKDGRTVSAAVRWQKAVKTEADDANVTMTVAYGFTAEVAGELGLSASTIERDLMLYRRLAPSLLARLRDAKHPVAKNAGQLRALAKLDDDAQLKAVGNLTRHANELSTFHGTKPIATVAEALAVGQPGAKAADPEAKRLSTFLGTFQRMGLAEKKGALAHLTGMLPAGFALVEGPLPKLGFSPQHETCREESLTAIDEAREAIDGLVEDELLDADRLATFERVALNLQLARVTIAGNGFDLAGAK